MHKMKPYSKPPNFQVKLIDEESLLKEITFLKLRPNQTSAATEPVSQKLLERLKIMDDLRFDCFSCIRSRVVEP